MPFKGNVLERVTKQLPSEGVADQLRLINNGIALWRIFLSHYNKSMVQHDRRAIGDTNIPEAAPFDKVST